MKDLIRTMNISDTFYIALCMTVLILGVVYWFWTQNQYIQRKLNQLENIVYEMKAGLNRGGPDSPSHYPPPPSSEGDDLPEDLHEELHRTLLATGAEESRDTKDTKETISPRSPPKNPDSVRPFVEAESSDIESVIEADVIEPLPEENLVSDDLQPGGVGSGIQEVVPPDSSKGGVLDTMTLKELKRLAEQRGITGTSSMRKPALIEAIRAAPVANITLDSSGATLSLS